MSPDSDAQVLVERLELETEEGSAGTLGTLRLHRPDVLNAITPQMLSEARAGLHELLADPAVSLIRLTGSGRAFSAGVDLKALNQEASSGSALEGGEVNEDLNGAARQLTHEIEAAPKIVLAQVNGFCFTGALELALACDIVVVAREAKLGDTHAKWGLRPTWGMSQRLPRLLGIARARELSYTARTFTGEQALEWGLAAFAPPLEDTEMVVLDLARQIAQNSAGSLSAYKDLYREALNRGLEDGLDYERTARYDIRDSEDRLREFL